MTETEKLTARVERLQALLDETSRELQLAIDRVNKAEIRAALAEAECARQKDLRTIIEQQMGLRHG